jgi:NDP-sugar pyrophosphorylase family protein
MLPKNDDHGPQAPGAIAACVLLAGGLRPSPLVLATGRNILDLYATEMRSNLDVWLARLEPLGKMPVRVVHGGDTPAPMTPTRDAWPDLTIERDPAGFRGPGGVIRDLSVDYPGESTVLVGEASRFVSCDISELVREHRRKNADATVGMNSDGSPAGVIAIRRSALDYIGPVGFVDLKEQWLTKVISSGGAVVAHPLRGAGAMLLRTRSDLLAAARVACGKVQGAPVIEPVFLHAGGPQAADTSDDTIPNSQNGFSVICAGARVASSAFIHDAVVMPGAEVGERAIVVRSIIAPGVRVESGAELIDVVAGANGARSDQWAASTKRLREER